MLRRALEQEARVGAAELDLDVAIGRQRERRRRRALPEGRAQRIDVMANANATGHDARLAQFRRRLRLAVQRSPLD